MGGYEPIIEDIAQVKKQHKKEMGSGMGGVREGADLNLELKILYNVKR